MDSPIQVVHQQNITGPLTPIAEKMTDAEIDRVIENGRRANAELHLRGNNGKVIENYSEHPNKGGEENVESNSETETSELE